MVREHLLRAILHWHKQANSIDAKVNLVLQEVKKMAGELAKLQQEVTENSDVIASAITLLGNLSQMLKDAIAANDPAALAALADTLDQHSNQLAAAVAANTPVASNQTAPTP